MFHTVWRVSVVIGIVNCSPVFDSDLIKPRFERNKVNKGVWLRNRQEGFERSSGGNFIFRANSLDVESQVQNDFDLFSSKQDGMLSGFPGRYKRSPYNKGNHRYRKSLDNKTRSATDSTPSLFNDYPYEVTVLRDSPNTKNIDYNIYPKYVTKDPIDNRNDTANDIKDELNDIKEKNNGKFKKDKDNAFEYLRDVANLTEGNVSIPKRSMYYNSDIDSIDLLESVNQSSNNEAYNNVREEKRIQAAPVPDAVYVGVTVPERNKNEVTRSKPISERGLIKVLSMLTKTFRKIMKQHNDIKAIHSHMQNMNDECKTKIEKHTKTLEDFDLKYMFFLNIMEKLKVLQDKLKAKEDSFKKKEEQISRSLHDFENQQRKFLTQQEQFYNIQKLLLAQNEKINHNQNTIAKTQSEISHRQNNFARVLEKARKLYVDAKIPKLTTTIAKPKDTTKNTTEDKKFAEILVTTPESIKINLFSIPATNPIENQDQLILKDKDDKTVDDLIYKYYFNNTFIDTIINNKILSGFFMADKTALARGAKHKRNNYKVNFINDAKLKSTLLLPLFNGIKLNSTLTRKRRWINHHSNRKHRRKHHGKTVPNRESLFNDERHNLKSKLEVETVNVEKQSTVAAPNDPFLLMATNFCNGIRQNETKQILDWCIEKALRKLKSLDTKLVSPTVSTITEEQPSHVTVGESLHVPTQTEAAQNVTATFTEAPTTTTTTTTSTSPMTITSDSTSIKPKIVTASEFNVFFPDNEELESNLKQFDLTEDTVGNVYYDGSLHESDLLGDKSETLSDFLPEFDSNSRVDIDTRAMELQSKRRFHSNRLNGNFNYRLGRGK